MLVNSSTMIVPGDILVFNCDPLAEIFMSYLKPVTKEIVDHQSNMAHPNPFPQCENGMGLCPSRGYQAPQSGAELFLGGSDESGLRNIRPDHLFQRTVCQTESEAKDEEKKNA